MWGKLTLWSQQLTSWNAVLRWKCQRLAEVDTTIMHQFQSILVWPREDTQNPATGMLCEPHVKREMFTMFLLNSSTKRHKKKRYTMNKHLNIGRKWHLNCHKGACSGEISWGNALKLDGVTGIFHWHKPSGCTMALGSTQPLTEKSARNISWGAKGSQRAELTTLPPSCADWLEIRETQPPGTLRACPGLYTDHFTNHHKTSHNTYIWQVFTQILSLNQYVSI